MSQSSSICAPVVEWLARMRKQHQEQKFFCFFFSKKEESSFVLRKRSKKTFIPGAVSNEG
jgi:hypothetical protein